MEEQFDFSPLIARRVPNEPAGQARGPVKYDFGTGFPDPGSLPLEGLHEALGRALKERGRDLARYPDPLGFLGMRQFIADKLRRERGMRVDPDQVLVTGGSGVALAIVSQLVANPGDTLLTDEYTYLGTLSVMRNVEANIVGVAADGEGMRADALDETVADLRRQGKPPKLVYIIPTFQNPLGTDMGLQRRGDILAVAKRTGVPIFEDDAYEDLRFRGTRHPAIHSMDSSGMVLYCGTFSKIIAPGMRVGYLVCPKPLMPRVSSLNWGRPTSEFAVLATYYYLRDHLDEHVAEICRILEHRRDVMLAAIAESLGSSAAVFRPDGGMYLWVRLPESADTTKAVQRARERGVTYTPGTAFSPSGTTGRNCFRLCFGYAEDQVIRDGIATLAEAFAEAGVLR